MISVIQHMFLKSHLALNDLEKVLRTLTCLSSGGVNRQRAILSNQLPAGAGTPTACALQLPVSMAPPGRQRHQEAFRRWRHILMRLSYVMMEMSRRWAVTYMMLRRSPVTMTAVLRMAPEWARLVMGIFAPPTSQAAMAPGVSTSVHGAASVVTTSRTTPEDCDHLNGTRRYGNSRGSFRRCLTCQFRWRLTSPPGHLPEIWSPDPEGPGRRRPQQAPEQSRSSAVYSSGQASAGRAQAKVQASSNRSRPSHAVPSTDPGEARPRCPDCQNLLRLRTNRADGRQFWGCRNFPRCRRTLPIAHQPDESDLDENMSVASARPGQLPTSNRRVPAEVSYVIGSERDFSEVESGSSASTLLSGA